MLLLWWCRFVRHLVRNESLVCVSWIDALLIFIDLVLVELLLLSPEKFLFCLIVGCPVVDILDCKISSSQYLKMLWKLSRIRADKLPLTILGFLVLILVI